MINKQTTLDLNGPILSFTTQPSSTAVNDGASATFVGIATATFPSQDPSNPATSTGSISYRWYDQNGPLSDGPNVTGTATTTLSLTNLSSTRDNNRRIYLQVDYIPSAYGLPGVAVTEGSARFTGNASNDPLNSNTVTLTVFSNISITSQPSSSTVSQDTTTTFNVSARLDDGTQTGLSYRWIFNGTDLTDGTSIPGLIVSGSGTPNLRISSSVIATNTIRARITHPTAGNSPIFSNTVQFGVTPRDFIVNTEVITANSSSATLSSHNLAVNGDLEFLAQNFTDPSTVVSLYAPDRDVEVEMHLYGGKGNDFSPYIGGQGGYSRIRFTMRQNEEYIISGLNSTDNCPFIYRKGTLIAAVGKGGNAAINGNGGAGGGVGVAGASGSGSGAGAGGSLIGAGQLTTTGILGSSSALSPRSPDTRATGQTGGRTISCPKGSYWINRGFSPCQDVGNTQFYLGNGTLISNTASIQRGYKQGYDIRQTSGAGEVASSFQRSVPRTCTRTVPQTCYRDVPNVVTRSANVTDVRGAIIVTDNSFFVVRYNDGASGTEGNRPGIIGYYFYVNMLGLENPSVSVSVLDTTTRASGLIDPNASIRFAPGYPKQTNPFGFPNPGGSIRLAFDMVSSIPGLDWGNESGPNRQSTYARSWRISVTGTQTTQQAYDCSTFENYDCSYYETVTVSGGGSGGSGATGGNGGTNGGSGGGGSGYSDGSVTILSTQSGGSNSARVLIRSTALNTSAAASDTPTSTPSPTPTPSTPALANIFYSSTILSAKPASGSVGSYSGFTDGSGSGANGFRFSAPSRNYFMELQITNANWQNSHGFVGICDETHWNDLNWTSNQGARLMWYIGNNFSYGEQTGSSLSGTNFTPTLESGDILGIVVNRGSGRVAFYKNGVYLVTISNSRAAGATLYVTVSDWYYRQALNCNALGYYSNYAVNYVLP